MQTANNWSLFFSVLATVAALWVFLELLTSLTPRWIRSTRKKRRFVMWSSILQRSLKIVSAVVLLVILVSMNYIVHGGLLVIVLVFAYPYISSYLSGLSFQLNPLISTGSKIATGGITGEIIRFLPFGAILGGVNGEHYVNYRDIEKQGFEVITNQGNTA
ncbi:MAG: hypothetical protein AAF740_09365, partial [Bacteroidota bacterium]